MATEGTETRKISLKSRDGAIFEVAEKAAAASVMIKHMIEGDCADGVISLPNVTGETLAKVLEYCVKHLEEPLSGDFAKEKEFKDWDANFVKVDADTLYDLITAANYLDIKGLLNLLCDAVANMIKGKSPEEIRRTFNIVNDFTPEEEAAIRRDYQWAFE